MKKITTFIHSSMLSAWLPIISLFFISFCAQAATETIPDANLLLLKKTITVFVNENKIPGIAAQVFVNGKPYTYYSGYADNANKQPVSNKTIFEVGSLSKIFTSLLLSQEIDFAKMNFNDSVRKYLPELPETFNKITLQELATHTSGLPFNVPGSVKSQLELTHYLSKWAPVYAPGKQWTYSNFGMGLLGYALEGATLRSFDDLYWRHVTMPLGMETRGTLLSEKQFKQNYAQGYDQNNHPVSHIEEGLFPAAYGIKVSVEDSRHFLSAAIGLTGTPERIFYPMRMTQAAFVKLSDRQQGLAWQIHEIKSNTINTLLHEPDDAHLGPYPVIETYERALFNGDALIDKAGSTAGFRAYVAVIPNKKSGIIILVNKSVPNSTIVNTGRAILFKLTKIIT